MKNKDNKVSKKIRSIIYITLGTIFLGVGCVGIAVPLLPTTPFLMLALFFYTMGSKRAERWFKSTKIYTKYLEPYIITKAMTNFSKIKILILITIVFSIPLVLVDNDIMRIVLLVVLLAHYVYFIFFVKSLSKSTFNELLQQKRKEISDEK